MFLFHLLIICCTHRHINISYVYGVRLCLLTNINCITLLSMPIQRNAFCISFRNVFVSKVAFILYIKSNLINETNVDNYLVYTHFNTSLCKLVLNWVQIKENLDLQYTLQRPRHIDNDFISFVRSVYVWN